MEMPKGRTKAAGTWNHDKKLDAGKARLIREKHLTGAADAALIAEFGISRRTLNDVIHYRTWAFAGPERRIGDQSDAFRIASTTLLIRKSKS